MALKFKDVNGNQTNAAGTTLATASMTMGSDCDLVVVALVTWDSVTIPTHQAPTDGQSNTYTQIGTTQAVPGGNIRISLWYCANPTTAATLIVTSHQSATTSARTIIAWCIASGGPTYNSDGAGNTGTSVTTQTVTTTGAKLGGLILAAMTNNTTATVSGPTDDDARSYNALTNSFDVFMQSSANQTDNSTFQDAFMGWIAPNDAAESASWTSTATNFAGLIAGFGDPAAAPTSRTFHRPFTSKPGASRFRSGRF